jgi:aspartate/methionine/tyrosine aminotransferase
LTEERGDRHEVHVLFLNTFSKQYRPKGWYWGYVSAFDASKPGNAWSGNDWAVAGQVVAAS